MNDIIIASLLYAAAYICMAYWMVKIINISLSISMIRHGIEPED